MRITFLRTGIQMPFVHATVDAFYKKGHSGMGLWMSVAYRDMDDAARDNVLYDLNVDGTYVEVESASCPDLNLIRETKVWLPGDEVDEDGSSTAVGVVDHMDVFRVVNALRKCPENWEK